VVNANKAKGTRWESAIALYLVSRGLGAKRKVQRGTADQGDLEITELPDVVLQAKDHGQMRMAEWVDAVAEQGKAAGAGWCFVVAKRRNKPVKDAYVVCDLETFTDMLVDVYEGQQALEFVELLERLAE